MEESLLKPLPQLGPRRKLHICTGSPYDKALKDMEEGYGATGIWYVADKMIAGDLVLSIVATAPRMIIGLAEVETDYDPYTSRYMECIHQTEVRFDQGILAKAVSNRCGWDSIPDKGPLTGRDARSLLKALDAEYQRDVPWFTPDRWREVQ
ncbi:hypothetical protein HQO82_19315 [Rhodococcus fascians]|nr:hypothetical protein [Rhodococcus fascians]MBY4115980.1 hypothetical protein [Rhodococcus fascians]